jgi:[acyl-carrier-protein] S-malonyltransferase
MTAVDSGVAAWVRGEPISVAEVDERMARVRGSAFGARLGEPSSAEGRNARRWVVQLLCAERLVRTELAGRCDEAASPAAEPLRLARALALGGVSAAVLAAVPAAITLVDAPEVDAEAVAGYYARNADRYADKGIGLDAATADIVQELQAASLDRAFRQWLDERLAQDVVLAGGLEHPADPGSPDATHRH